MNGEKQLETSPPIPAKRLWFGFTGAAIAWILAGLLDVLFAWQACVGGEAGSFVFTQTGIRILLGVITFGLLSVGVAAGLISFRNWRALSRQNDLTRAEGRGRQEFMALAGVFVAASLGIGMVWFSIPIYILSMCERAH